MAGGQRHLRRIDGRTAEGLRERDLMAKLAAELGVDMIADLPFEAEQLARAVVRLSLECEIIEADRAEALGLAARRKAEGRPPFDAEVYARLRQQQRLTLTELRGLLVETEPVSLTAAQGDET